jgi:hypothetical protein
MASFTRALREFLLLVLLVGCPGSGDKGEQSEFERYRRRVSPPAGERVLPDLGTEPSRESTARAEFWWPEAKGGDGWAPDWRPGSGPRNPSPSAL